MSSFTNYIKKDNQIIFNVRDVDVSILNALRRIILSEIENVAFEFEPYKLQDKKVNIINNTCPLHNEIILQRLSLIPINLTPNEIIDFDDTKYKFVINKKNNTNKIIDVTTEDFDIYQNDKILSKSQSLKIFPTDKYSNDHILITKLKPNLIDNNNGDTIHIEAYPSKNIPKKHAGYSFVSKCVYFNIVDEKKANIELKNRIKKYKQENNTVSNDDIDNLTKDFNNLDKARFFHKNQFDEPNFFQFDIETEYSIKPEYLLFKAFNILNDKLDNLIDNITNEKFKFQKLENSYQLYDIIIENEKHTLGNLIQALFYNIFIRKNESKQISYVGYRVEHPLEETVIIRIKLDKNIEENKISQIFIDGLDEMQKILRKLNKEWLEVSKLSKTYATDLADF